MPLCSCGELGAPLEPVGLRPAWLAWGELAPAGLRDVPFAAVRGLGPVRQPPGSVGSSILTRRLMSLAGGEGDGAAPQGTRACPLHCWGLPVLCQACCPPLCSDSPAHLLPLLAPRLAAPLRDELQVWAGWSQQESAPILCWGQAGALRPAMGAPVSPSALSHESGLFRKRPLGVTPE